MGCMEHLCAACEYFIGNNEEEPPSSCPRCGSTSWLNSFDEDWDTDPPDEYNRVGICE